MSRPYMVPEKIPEIHLIDHDDIPDVENQGEKRNLLFRPVHGEIKYRHAEPYKKLIVVIVVLLLASVIAAIGALKMRCSSGYAADSFRHVGSFPGVFKRIVVPPGWNEKSNSLAEVETTADVTKRIVVPAGWKDNSNDLTEVETTADVTKRIVVPAGTKEPSKDGNLFERDFTLKRPQGWAGNVPLKGINKRGQDSWKKPKGWHSIEDINKRATNVWKNPKGWKGRIGSIGRRATWTKAGSTAVYIGSPGSTAGSTVGAITDSLSTVINASITVPLYSYPGKGAQDWAPMFKALNSSSSTKFTIIINPDNGPGSGDPDANFQIGIKKLKSFANAEVFGYVHQSYGKRNITDVQADLRAYAAWRAPKIGISIDGIFFDESPDTAANAPYVATVNTFAKAQGLSTTIQNAGTIPSKEYFAPTQNTDITVILEDSFDDYDNIAAKYDNLAAQYGVSKSAFSFIIYEAPTDSQSIRSAVAKMTKQVGHVFMSDLTQAEAYTSISNDHFTTFISAMVKAFSSSTS
ncbi:hypothetical protein TWF481_009900 [Arthrobotrys musiformis]|uniref:Spherulin-4 n=1 Tax=Arthrobotrys musiformis TaxID=47236 RepID=A0AAV9W5A6_9PEZI